MRLSHGRPILAVTPRRRLAVNVFATVLRLLGLSRRARARGPADPADMGTAFGLDACTTLDADSIEAAAARAWLETADHFQLRLHRRSSV